MMIHDEESRKAEKNHEFYGGGCVVREENVHCFACKTNFIYKKNKNE